MSRLSAVNAMALLNFEGSNGSTTFTDASKAALTFTAVGNAEISTAQFKTGASSLLLDGTGDYIWTAALGSTDWYYDLDFYDISVDAWIYLTGTPGADACIMARWNSAGAKEWWLGMDSSRQVKLKYRTSATDKTITTTTVIAQNQWVHVRFLKFGANLGIFVDGVLAGSATDGSTWDAYGSIRVSIGADGNGADVIPACYIDSVVVNLNNVLDGLRSFTPPTTFPVRELDAKLDPLLESNQLVGPSGGTGLSYIDLAKKLPIYTIVLGDAEAVNPDTPSAAFTGTVTNEGLPVQRTLYAIRRDTVKVVSTVTSDPVTGAFSILLVPNVEHMVVCLDDLAGTVKNDLIKRKTIVV